MYVSRGEFWQLGGGEGEEAGDSWRTTAAAAKAPCDKVEARESERQVWFGEIYLKNIL